MKKLIKQFLVFIFPMLKLFLLIFFDKKYLQGRHFDGGFAGVYWGIKSVWTRNILRIAPPRPFPVALTCVISDPKNILFHPDDLNNFQSPGCYFQNFKAKIHLGKGVYIAPNVGLITVNHKIESLDEHEEGRDIIIGDASWIGMNSVILPGVILGEKTIVAAGAVVTRSFPEGNVVLAGVPAKPIKTMN